MTKGIGAFLMASAILGGPALSADASGRFSVTLAELPNAPGGTAQHGLLKRFDGDLVGTSSGVMLSAGDPASGIAGYVAMERVEGTLAGRTGSFALQHSGTMEDGSQQMHVVIVPGSGTGGLAGIRGHMTIRITGRDHFYTLSYALPAAP